MIAVGRSGQHDGLAQLPNDQHLQRAAAQLHSDLHACCHVIAPTYGPLCNSLHILKGIRCTGGTGVPVSTPVADIVLGNMRRITHEVLQERT